MTYNELFGIAGHTADSRLDSWINGDSDGNGVGDVLDVLGNHGGVWFSGSAYGADIKGPNKSLSLNGTDRVTLDAGTAYFPDPDYNNFSICLRFNADALSGKQMLWETGGSQVCQAIHLDGTTLYAVVAGGNVATSVSMTVGSGDHSVVMTVDGDTLTLYVDGETPVSTTGASTSRSNAGSNVGCIGRVNGSARYADQSTSDTGAFSGLVADIATFIGVLTASEAAEYIAGREPLNTAAGTIAVQGGGDPEVGCVLEVDTAATYDSQNNGTVSVTYRWFVNDVYQSTGPTFDTTGLSVDDVVEFQSRGTNDGGYDPAEDTDSSNAITVVAAETGIDASLTATLDGVTASATAAGAITAGLTATLDGVTADATATNLVSAGVSSSLAGVTVTATAGAPSAAASVTATLAGVAGSSTAQAQIAAGVTSTLDGVSADATATNLASAGVSSSLDGVTVTATAGTSGAAASVTATLVGVAASSTAEAQIAAGVTSTLSGVSGVASATVQISGGVTAQLDGVTVAGTLGSDAASVTLTATLAGVTASSTVEAQIAAGVTSTLDGVAGVAAATSQISAGVTVELDGVTPTVAEDDLDFLAAWAAGANVFIGLGA